MIGQTGGWKRIFNAFAIHHFDRIGATPNHDDRHHLHRLSDDPLWQLDKWPYRSCQTTRGPRVCEPSNSVIDRWLNEGGHDVSDHSRSDLVTRIATAEKSELAAMWPRVVREWGDDASSLWQEALSASDASET